MSDKIAIQYDAVYTKCAELCTSLKNEVATANTAYALMRKDLQGNLDSRAMAEFDEAMAANRRKAELNCEVMQRLLLAMELSAKQVQYDEGVIKGTFTLAQTTTVKTEGAE